MKGFVYRRIWETIEVQGTLNCWVSLSVAPLRNSVIEVSIVRNGTVRKDAKIRRKRV